MEYKFGDSNIITCYIKELLHSFNLPRITVYTEELEEQNAIYEGKTYIKDNLIVKYENGRFNKIANYVYNYPVVNLTKNFIIKSSTYDQYTHEYLGNYLRFLRDYLKIDLMSLYNCFSGKEPSRILLSDKDEVSGIKIINDFRYTLDTDNPDFNYYIVPVKFDKTYTIALNCSSSYDLACILYGDIFVSKTPDVLVQQSYMHVDGSTFYNPFTYSTNWSCTKDLELWKREKDLKLVLKLPKNIETSVVILEGDYTQSSNIVDNLLFTKFKDNFEYKNGTYLNIPTKLFSKNSLLDLDDKIIHPFSDSLIIYLLKHAITNIEFIPKNIEYVQDLVYPTGIKGYYGVWDDLLKYNIYNRTLKDDLLKGTNKKYSNTIISYNNDSGITLENKKIRYLFIAPDFYTTITKSETDAEGREIITTIKNYTNILPQEQVEIDSSCGFVLQVADRLIDEDTKEYIVDSEGNYAYGEYTTYGFNIPASMFNELNDNLKFDYISFDNEFIINNLLYSGNEKEEIEKYTIFNMYNLIPSHWEEIKEFESKYPLKELILDTSSKVLQVSKVEANKREIRYIDTHKDILGYVDRDTETLLNLQKKQGVV